MKSVICFALTAVFFCVSTSIAKDKKEADKKEKKGFTSIVVLKSGGFAGISETYKIQADGSFEKASRRKTSKGKLKADELTKFKKSVDAIDWKKLPAKKHTKGADFFKYDVTIITGGKTYRRQFDGQAYPKNKAMREFLLQLGKIR